MLQRVGKTATHKILLNGAFWRLGTHLLRNMVIATHPKASFAKLLKAREKRPADGISGCCDRKVGATATHLAFSCFRFDPVFKVEKGLILLV